MPAKVSTAHILDGETPNRVILIVIVRDHRSPRFVENCLVICIKIAEVTPAIFVDTLAFVLEGVFALDRAAHHGVLIVEEAIERHGTPEIFNTDQGSQFTSLALTKLLKHHDIRISMDGKGSWRDNVFVERLWRSVKYEEVYLKAYETVCEVKVGLGNYLRFYNGRRPHSSLERQTPDQVYFNQLSTPRAA